MIYFQLEPSMGSIGSSNHSCTNPVSIHELAQVLQETVLEEQRMWTRSTNERTRQQTVIKNVSPLRDSHAH